MTPHEINIVTEDGKAVKSIPASGAIARCAVARTADGEIDGIPVSATSFGAVEGLPDPSEGTYYIVSGVIASAAKGRSDLFVPDELVRDSSGKIIGCKGLARQV